MSVGFPVQTTTFECGVVNPRFLCSRQLRVAAGKRRARVVGSNGRRPKIESERRGKEHFLNIDHKVWVS